MYTITVTSTAATNDEGTLPWAIAQANAYTGTESICICFADELAGQTITLNGGLTLSKAAVLTGPASGLTIAGGTISSTAPLTISHITLPQIALSGTASLTAEEGVVFTSAAAVTISSSWNGTIDLHGSTAAASDAYVSLSGTINGDSTFAALPDSYTGNYRHTNSVTIESGKTVTLEDGAAWELYGRTLRLYGTLRTEQQEQREVISAHDYAAGCIVVFDGGLLSVKNSDIKLTSLLVYSGGKLEMQGGSLNSNIVFDTGSSASLHSTQVNHAGNVYGDFTATDCTFNEQLYINEQTYGDFTATDCTFNSYLSITETTHLQGSGNIFTGSETLRLSSFSGSTAELFPFIGSATAEDAYISLNGHMNHAIFTAIPTETGIQQYRLIGSVTIDRYQTVTLEDGAAWKFDGGSLVIYGTLRSEQREQREVIGSLSNNYGVRVYDGGLLSTTNGDINLTSGVQVFSGGRLEMEGGSLNASSVCVDNGGLLTTTDCDINLTAWERSFEVYSGGRLEMEGGSLNTDSIIFFDTGSSASLHGTQVKQDVWAYGDFTATDCTFNRALWISETTHLQGSDNIFTSGGDVIVLNNLGIDLKDFHASATQSDATISIPNLIDTDTRLTRIGENLDTYNIRYSGLILESSLYLEEGVTIRNREKDFHISLENNSRMEAQSARMELLGIDDSKPCLVRIHKGAVLNLNDTDIICAPGADGDLWDIQVDGGSLIMNDVRMAGTARVNIAAGSAVVLTNERLSAVTNSGNLELQACTVEQPLTNAGTLTANETIFHETLTLASGSSFSGHNNVFLGNGAVISCVSTSDFSQFRATATRPTAHIQLSDNTVKGTAHYYKLGEGLDTYIADSLTINADCALFLHEGAKLRTNGKNVVVLKGAHLVATQADIEAAILNQGDLTLTDCALEQEVTNEGSLTANSTIFNENLKLREGAALSGNGNTFLGYGAVISASADTDFSNFSASAAQANSYIELSEGYIRHDVHYYKLGDGLDTYRTGWITVSSDAALMLHEGSKLLLGKLGVTILGGADMEATGAYIDGLIDARGHLSATDCTINGEIVIQDGAELSFRNTTFNEQNVFRFASFGSDSMAALLLDNCVYAEGTTICIDRLVGDTITFAPIADGISRYKITGSLYGDLDELSVTPGVTLELRECAPYIYGKLECTDATLLGDSFVRIMTDAVMIADNSDIFWELFLVEGSAIRANGTRFGNTINIGSQCSTDFQHCTFTHQEVLSLSGGWGGDTADLFEHWQENTITAEGAYIGLNYLQNAIRLAALPAEFSGGYKLASDCYIASVAELTLADGVCLVTEGCNLNSSIHCEGTAILKGTTPSKEIRFYGSELTGDCLEAYGTLHLQSQSNCSLKTLILHEKNAAVISASYSAGTETLLPDTTIITTQADGIVLFDLTLNSLSCNEVNSDELLRATSRQGLNTAINRLTLNYGEVLRITSGSVLTINELNINGGTLILEEGAILRGAEGDCDIHAERASIISRGGTIQGTIHASRNTRFDGTSLNLTGEIPLALNYWDWDGDTSRLKETGLFDLCPNVALIKLKEGINSWVLSGGENGGNRYLTEISPDSWMEDIQLTIGKDVTLFCKAADDYRYANLSVTDLRMEEGAELLAWEGDEQDASLSCEHLEAHNATIGMRVYLDSYTTVEGSNINLTSRIPLSIAFSEVEEAVQMAASLPFICTHPDATVVYSCSYGSCDLRINDELLESLKIEGCKQVAFKGIVEDGNISVDKGTTLLIDEYFQLFDAASVSFGNGAEVRGTTPYAALSVESWDSSAPATLYAENTTFYTGVYIGPHAIISGHDLHFAASGTAFCAPVTYQQLREGSQLNFLEDVSYDVIGESAFFGVQICIDESDLLSEDGNNVVIDGEKLQALTPAGFRDTTLDSIQSFVPIRTLSISGVKISSTFGGLFYVSDNLYISDCDFLGQGEYENAYMSDSGNDETHFVLERSNCANNALYISGYTDTRIQDCTGIAELTYISDRDSKAIFTGNDFSRTLFKLDDAEGTIDISGNYWGTMNREEILARFDGFNGTIFLDSILSSPDEARVFAPDAKSAAGLRLEQKSRDITIGFTDVIDATTATPHSVSLYNEKGERMEISSISVSGHLLTIRSEQALETGSYTVSINPGLCSVEGTRAQETQIGLAVTRMQTAVLLVQDGNKSGRKLEYIDVYLRDSVSAERLKAAAHLSMSETGEEINITAVQQLIQNGRTFYRLLVDPIETKGTYELVLEQNTVLHESGLKLSESYRHSIRISSADLIAVSASEGSAAIICGNQQVPTFRYSVTNVGDDLIGSWVDTVYTCPTAEWNAAQATVLLRIRHTDEALSSGESYTQEVSPDVLHADLDEEMYVFVRTDSGNSIHEDDEANNIVCLGSYIKRPDTLSTGTPVPISTKVGQTLYWEWTADADAWVYLDSEDAVVCISEKGWADVWKSRLTLYNRTIEGKKKVTFEAEAGKTYYIAHTSVSDITAGEALIVEALSDISRISTTNFTVGQNTVQLTGTNLNKLKDFRLITVQGDVIACDISDASPSSLTLSVDVPIEVLRNGITQAELVCTNEKGDEMHKEELRGNVSGTALRMAQEIVFAVGRNHLTIYGKDLEMLTKFALELGGKTVQLSDVTLHNIRKDQYELTFTLTEEQLAVYPKDLYLSVLLQGYDSNNRLLAESRSMGTQGSADLTLSYDTMHYGFYIRDGSVLELGVTCSNEGNANADAPLILVRESVLRDMLYYEQVSTYTAEITPARKALLFMTGQQGEDASMMERQEKSSVRFYERSLSENEATLTYLLEADNTRALSDEEWELLESALRPFSVPDAAWAAWWQDMRARMGTRECDVVAFVKSMQQELSTEERAAAHALPDVVQRVITAHADFKPSLKLEGHLTLSHSGDAYAGKELTLCCKRGEEWVEVSTVRTDEQGSYCFYGLDEDTHYALKTESGWFNGSYQTTGDDYLVLPDITDDTTLDGVVSESLTDEHTSEDTDFRYLSDGEGHEYRLWLHNGILTLAQRQENGWGKAVALSEAGTAAYETAWDAENNSILCVWLDAETGTFYHREVSMVSESPLLTDLHTLTDLRSVAALQSTAGGGFNIIGRGEDYHMGDAYDVYALHYSADDFAANGGLALTLPDTSGLDTSLFFEREYDFGIFKFTLNFAGTEGYDSDCQYSYSGSASGNFEKKWGNHILNVVPSGGMTYTYTSSKAGLQTNWSTNLGMQISYMNRMGLIYVLETLLRPMPVFYIAVSTLGKLIEFINNRKNSPVKICAGVGMTLNLQTQASNNSADCYVSGSISLDSLLSVEAKDDDFNIPAEAETSLSLSLGLQFKSQRFELADFIRSASSFMSIAFESSAKIFGLTLRVYLNFNASENSDPEFSYGIEYGLSTSWNTAGYITPTAEHLESMTTFTLGNELLSVGVYSENGESMLTYAVNDSTTGTVTTAETQIDFSAVEGAAGMVIPEHYVLTQGGGAVAADGNSAIYTVCFGSAVDEESLPATMTIEEFNEWYQGIVQQHRLVSFRYRDNHFTLLDSSATDAYTAGLTSKAQQAYDGKDYLAWTRQREDGMYELYVSRCEGDAWGTPVCLLQSERCIEDASLTVSSEGLLCSFTAQRPIADSEFSDTCTYECLLNGTQWQSPKNAMDGTAYLDEPQLRLWVEQHAPELRDTDTGALTPGMDAWWNNFVRRTLRATAPAFPNCKETPKPPKRPLPLGKNTKRSWDPNDIAGPEGVGAENYVAPGHYNYLIRCENDANEAVASAARVLITQQLDKNLDWSTFRLGNIHIAGIYIEIPDGVSNYQDVLDWTDTLGVLVEVKAGIDYKTGIVSWSLIALDPETHDIPSNAFVGLLAPNVNAPEGEAWVQYSIDAKENAPHDTVINAQASIVFDWNDPIATPAISCRLDTTAPEAAMRTEVQRLDTTRYAIAWEGRDTGSGIDAYDIYLSRDGGEWNLWASGITETSAIFTAEEGEHLYTFCAMARDKAGNVQTTPGEYLQLTADSKDYEEPAALITGYVPLYHEGKFCGLSISGDSTRLQEFREADFADLLRMVNPRTGTALALSAADFRYDAELQRVLWTPQELPEEAVYIIAVQSGNRTGAGVLLQSGTKWAQGTSYAAPILIDLNSDGALDLVVGEKTDTNEGRIRLYLNNGTTENPLYGSFTYAQTAQGIITLPATGCLGAAPSMADINGDGLEDLVIGQANGTLSVYIRKNNGSAITWEDHGQLTTTDGAHSATIDAGDRATPLFIDWNGDGLTDLLLGNMDGTLTVHLNNGSETAPTYAPGYLVYDGAEPLQVPGGRSSFAVADFDGDGIRDLISGNTDGSLYFYHNYGTNAQALFSGCSRLTDTEGNTRLGGEGRSRLYAADLNGDDAPDLIVGGSDGSVQSYLTAPFTPLGSFSTKDIDKPETVTDVQVQVKGSRITATWEPVSGSSVGYEVRLTGINGTHLFRLSEPMFTTKAEDGEYTLEIRAVDADVSGDWTPALPMTVDTQAPNEPTALLAVAEQGTVSLSWCPVSDAAQYEIRYQAAHSKVWQYVCTSSTALTLSGMDADSYMWQIRATDAFGNASAWADGHDFTATPAQSNVLHYWATGLSFNAGGALTGGYEDVNKSGLSDSKLCWAAAASNALAWWQHTGGEQTLRDTVPSTAEDIYATFCTHWNNASGQDAYGFIWWLSGESDSESYTSYAAQHLHGNPGGYYRTYYPADQLNETIRQESLLRRSPDELLADWAGVYAEGGMLTLGIFRENEGDGLLIDGHSLTLWGFTADAATGNITELAVTDSDDGVRGIITLQVSYDADAGCMRITGGAPKLQGYVLGTATQIRAFCGGAELLLHEPQIIKNGDGTVTITFTWESDEAATYQLTIGGQTHDIGGVQQYTLSLPESARRYTLTATLEDGRTTTLEGTLRYDETAAQSALIRFRHTTEENAGLYATAGDTIGGGDTQDYYCFTAAEDGTYAIGTDITTPGGSFLLSLGTVDAAGDYVVQRSLTTGKGSTNAIEGINLRKGETAYIRISSEAAAETAYELRVAGEVPAAASITDNNTAATADALVGSTAPAAVQGWVGAGDACDFYRLQLAEASNLQLSLSGVDTAARVKVYAEQADGSRALLSAGTATAVSGLDRTLALTAGSYYIEVAALNPDGGLGNSAYTMEIKEQKGKQSTHYMLAAR